MLPFFTRPSLKVCFTLLNMPFPQGWDLPLGQQFTQGAVLGPTIAYRRREGKNLFQVWVLDHYRPVGIEDLGEEGEGWVVIFGEDNAFSGLHGDLLQSISLWSL